MKTRIPFSAAAALAALSLLAGLSQPIPAAADPLQVTLVGSLQDELGCPGDWQPGCTDTVLDPVPGKADLYTGSFELRKGSYEYKVAIGGSWDENYGADGVAGGANLTLAAPGGTVSFSYDATTHVISDDAPKGLVGDQSAQWLTKEIIALRLPAGSSTYRGFAAAEGGLRREGEDIVGGESVDLKAQELPASLLAKHPQLKGYAALRVPSELTASLRGLLTGELAVASYGKDGRIVAVTGVQIPWVLDALYPRAAERRLGPSWTRGIPTLALWAPTAKSVALLLSDDDGVERRVAMSRDSDGVWSVAGKKGWRNAPYRFEVKVFVPNLGAVATNQVTDPYSVALTTNSERSVLADLDSAALKPKGWKKLRKPKLTTPERSTIYELHVRDFSISDASVERDKRGTYLAFTDPRTEGMRHLRTLARAGLNTVHLLPVNDIASIEEDRAKQQEPQCDLAAYAPDSEEQQACVDAVAANDGFNWGYDPLHYTAPEGSYSTDPDGTARNLEFRQMVQGLNKIGQRVVMDVVYNHTPAAGQAEKSILDRVVPGYYHRLSPGGQVETSTCCSNTATEHAMMEKLMIDSVLTWAKQYKLDGFRFDLMGHQPKSAMLELRARLDKLTVARDSVDGKRIYLYGEGWNFGEVADNAQFVQATQAEMAGTGIGTFNDRLRDSVRGGGPFDESARIQGFGSGQYTDPNGDPANGTEAEQKASLLLNQDRIRVGLAGNLADYRFIDRFGRATKGSEVDYNGSATGYAADPQETVNYVSAHDNETLYDALVYKLPNGTSMQDRVRMQNVSLATTALGQGVSFWHAGSDLLRSKSLDRNSYNSGDWFNVLDFTGNENGFGRGLPPKEDNAAKWPIQRGLLGRTGLDPAPRDVLMSRRQSEELLRIRNSTPLFHLGTAAEIQSKVLFANTGPDQTPGVIVMAIDDTRGARVDERWSGLVVVFNAGPKATEQTLAEAKGERLALHPVQRWSYDSVVRRASVDRATGTFRVPARTVAVFVRR